MNWRHTLPKSSCMAAVLFLLLISSASAANTNPFDAIPKLRDYAQRAIQAVQSQAPLLLKVAKVDDKEIDDVYQYLTTQTNMQLPIWQLSLLDYPRLRLLRNHIYAGYGRSFTSADLDAYFRSLKWYEPVNTFTESRLSSVDKENISTITRLEYIKFHQHEQLGKIVKLTEGHGEESESRQEKANKVPGIDGSIMRAFTGCCGVSEGSTRIFNKNGMQFHSSFGSEVDGNGSMEYIMPLWGGNLVAWIIGERNTRRGDNGPALYDRIAILSASGKPLIDLHLPYGSLPTGDYLDQIGMSQLVLISPNILYSSTADRYDGDDSNTQFLLFVKSNLPFKPQVKDLFTWRDQENTDIKFTKKNITFAPVVNPKVLWSRVIFDRYDPIFTQDRIYFLRRMTGSPDIFTAIDKLSGREIFSYHLPVKADTLSVGRDQKGYAVTDKTLVVVGDKALHFMEIDSGRLIKTMMIADLGRALHIPIDRYFNYSTVDIASYNNIILYGKGLYESDGETVYLLAFDTGGNLLWNYKTRVKQLGGFDRNGRLRQTYLLNDAVCLVNEHFCDRIDLVTGKLLSNKKLSSHELGIDLSGKDQLYPAAVWKDKNAGDNYFEPRIMHKDNNYIYVQAKTRYWAIGEEALHDYLRRSNKLVNPSQINK